MKDLIKSMAKTMHISKWPNDYEQENVKSKRGNPP